MDSARIEELRKIVEVAGPCDWRIGWISEVDERAEIMDVKSVVAIGEIHHRRHQALVCHAVNSLPELLDEVERLRAENDELKYVHEGVSKQRFRLVQQVVDLEKKLEDAVKTMKDMLEHLCDGTENGACSQMWYQDVIEECLERLKL